MAEASTIARGHGQQDTYTEEQLRRVCSCAESWLQAAEMLAVADSTGVRRKARKLGIDLQNPSPMSRHATTRPRQPRDRPETVTEHKGPHHGR
jgi:hypothetical protein